MTRKEAREEAIKELNKISMHYPETADECYTVGNALNIAVEALEKMNEVEALENQIGHCKTCMFNYGLHNGEEFNPKDIVCTYWESDGLSEDDFCSQWKENKE